MEKKTLNIIKFRKAWYNFDQIPQDTYIAIRNVRCVTDKQAIKQAKKINPNFDYEIEEKEND